MIWHESQHTTSGLGNFSPGGPLSCRVNSNPNQHIRSSNECILGSLESYRQVCLIMVGAKLCRTVALHRTWVSQPRTTTQTYVCIKCNIFMCFKCFSLFTFKEFFWHICDFVLISELCDWTEHLLWYVNGYFFPWFCTIVVQRCQKCSQINTPKWCGIIYHIPSKCMQ